MYLEDVMSSSSLSLSISSCNLHGDTRKCPLHQVTPAAVDVTLHSSAEGVAEPARGNEATACNQICGV